MTDAPKNGSFEELLEKNGTLIYPNKGVSMMPLLREGRDLMVIERKGAERCRRYDAVLFKRRGPAGRASYVLHRVLRVNGDGTYWIVGDNCISGETVREEQVLGVLTAVVRDGRTVAVTDWAYRLYVRVWWLLYPVRRAAMRLRGAAARCLRRTTK